MGDRPILKVLKVVGITLAIVAVIVLIVVNLITSRKQASTEEAPRINNEFNNLFAVHKGTQVGNNVRSLVAKMISNAEAHKTEADKLPDLYYQAEEFFCIL